MRTKHLLLSLITIITSLDLSFSQIPIGYYYDADGMPIEGFFDLINYHPQNIVDVSPNALYYESGCYYGLDDQRYVGFIKYDNNDFYFTSNLSNQGVTLNPNNVKGLRVGVDSFFVALVPALQPRHTGAKNQDPVFLHHIALTEDYHFAIHYYNTSGYAVNYLGRDAITKVYCYKKHDKLHWRSIPKNKKQFSDLWLDIFEEDSLLKVRLEDKVYSINDALNLIKVYEYQFRMMNDKEIDLDPNWQELSLGGEKRYTGRIINKVDSIWTINYYDENDMIYSVEYSSFFPHIKNGAFLAFDSNQNLRLKSKFKNNSMITTQLFSSNGRNKYAYVKQRETSTSKQSLKYIDVDGVSRGELYSDNIVQVNFYDSIREVEIAKDFKFGKLISSHFDMDGTKIYQMCDPNFKLDLGYFTQRAKGYFKNKSFKESSKEGVEGIILTSFLINSKGIPIKFEILNELHPEINVLYEEFLNRSIGNLKFKPYKVNSKKVIYEFVVPLKFSFNRYYRESAFEMFNSYPYWNESFHRNGIPVQKINEHIPEFID